MLFSDDFICFSSEELELFQMEVPVFQHNRNRSLMKLMSVLLNLFILRHKRLLYTLNHFMKMIVLYRIPELFLLSSNSFVEHRIKRNAKILEISFNISFKQCDI